MFFFQLLDSLTSALLNTNIASIISQVSLKIPHLCALVKSVKISAGGAITALLQDPTGSCKFYYISVRSEFNNDR